MQFDHQWLDTLAKGLLSAMCFQGVRILSQMKESVNSLNERVGVIVERTEWHSREIKRLDSRLSRVEDPEKRYDL